MNYIPLLLLLIGGIVLTIGDIIMKKWVISHSTYIYVIGLAVYLVAMNFLAQSFRYKNIAVASVIFVIFNVVVLSVVSWLYFKESMNGLQVMGIFLGLASVAMLELS